MSGRTPVGTAVHTIEFCSEIAGRHRTALRASRQSFKLATLLFFASRSKMIYQTSETCQITCTTRFARRGSVGQPAQDRSLVWCHQDMLRTQRTVDGSEVVEVSDD
ncbi:MAG: hypothetical protein F4X07_05345 [Acidimicrobiaceae bacterium]|nr:hypothetical protein [Acidimicrobiaceae bacterium]